MSWFKKAFGKSEIEKTENTKMHNLEVSTFTLYTVTGLVDNLKEEDWTNSEYDPLTETEKAYVLKLVRENTGKIFYKYNGEYENLIRGFTRSCDKDRPDLFLGRQIQGKSFHGSISKHDGVITKIHIKYLDNSEKDITDPKEIQSFLTLIDK